MSAQMYHTPLDLARRHGHGTVVEVLKSKAMQIVSAHLLHVHVTCDVILIYCSSTCTVCGLDMCVMHVI